MTWGKKLTDEISVSELQEYRRQGMSNKEIAKFLDISLPTVYRYIGRQDGKPHKRQTRQRDTENVVVLDGGQTSPSPCWTSASLPRARHTSRPKNRKRSRLRLG